MFVLSFKNGDDDFTRHSFDQYCLPLVEIKDFNVLIDNKLVFDQQEAYEKLIKMLKTYEYITGNLLDYLYQQKYYKLIGIDLSRRKNTSIPQTN